MLAPAAGPRGFDLFPILVLNMTMRHPSLRGWVFFVGFGFALLLCAGAGCILVLVCASSSLKAAIAELPLHKFWFTYNGSSPADALPRILELAAVMVLSLFSALAVLRARFLYLGSRAPALLFFVVYLFMICMEGLRACAVFLYASGAALRLIPAISRAVYGARFAGQLALLLTALCMLELKYHRYMFLLGILTLVSFAIAVYIPMDNTVLLSSFTYKLGDEQGAQFADLALGILTAAAMAAAAYTKKKPWFYATAGASVLLFAGRQIISFTASPAVLAGGLLFIAGGISVFLIALGKVYGETENG
jgi:hypothetical protein